MNIEQAAGNFLRKIFLTLTFLKKNNLTSHAASTAFAFLFSVPPAVLLVIIFLNHWFSSFPAIVTAVTSFLNDLNITLHNDFTAVEQAAFGVFGILGLLWSSRMFIVSIQKGLSSVFPVDGKASPLRRNALHFLVLAVLGCAFAAIGILDHGIGGLISGIAGGSEPAKWVLLEVERLLINSVLAFLTFLSFLYLPPKRPGIGAAAAGALFFILAAIVVRSGFGIFVDPSRYNLIYGLLGSLMFILMFVYIVSILYFLGAEFCYVWDSYEVLVFDKLYEIGRGRENADRIGHFVFSNPDSILEKYARMYGKEAVLFREGEPSKEAYILISGRIDICLKRDGRDVRIASVREGEIFGETAYLLDERRTATALAGSDSFVMVLEPQIFEKLLQLNRTFSRDIICLLSDRLKGANRKLKL